MVKGRFTKDSRESEVNGSLYRNSEKESVNHFDIYESKIRPSIQPNAPKNTYLNQISSHILSSGEKALEPNNIRKMTVNKSMWIQKFVVSKKKKPTERSTRMTMIIIS